MTDIQTRVAEIYALKIKLDEEIAQLQSECQHPEYEVGWYSWRIGCMELKRICCHCRKILGDPSDKERFEYRDGN